MSLIAANAELKRLRSKGWKAGMNKVVFSADCLETEHDMSLAQIAEILYFEGITETLYKKAAISNIIRRGLAKLRSTNTNEE